MNPWLFLFLLIPIAITLFTKFYLKWDINKTEFVVQILVSLLIITLMWVGGRFQAASDVEYLNGEVTGKFEHTFPCPKNTSNPCHNGYTCNVRTVCTGSGENRRCRTTSDTCYRYPWERDWYVKTNLGGGDIEISRVDEQGARTPPRWASTVIGEPASRTHHYKNWVKGSRHSLFHERLGNDENYRELFPEKEEIKITDYYRADRFHNHGLQIPRHIETHWNENIGIVLKTLGPQKQMNLQVVVVQGANDDYAHVLRRAWRGFKKNEAVMFFGVDRNGVVRWTDSMSWSSTSLYDVKVETMLNEYRGQRFLDLNANEILNRVHPIAIEAFNRRPMAEFEYLKSSIPVPTWLVVLSIICAIGVSSALSYFFHKNDIGDISWQLANAITRR